MFFSSKPTHIVFIHRNGLVAYNAAGQSAQMEMPVGVVSNLEVLDQKKLQELVGNFATAQKFSKQKVLCLLNDTVVFQKTIPKTVDLKKATDEFVSQVPFNPDARVILSIPVKDQTILLGTNKVLYLAIATGLQSVGCKISAVAPAAVFGVANANTLTHEQVKKVLSDSQLAERANFLAANSN